MSYQLFTLVVFFCILSISFSYRLPLHSVDAHATCRGTHNVPWDHFMLVTEWPQSSCEFVNSTHKHDCVIPSAVKGWILHGLWPSSSHGAEPSCCTKDKFDMDKVKDLESDLLMYWPNLFKGEGETSFWTHEYEKHGTCAASVSRFSTEHSFFEQTLILRNKFDPMEILEQNNVSPGEEGYELSQIRGPIEDSFGVSVCIECSYIKSTRQQLLSGMYVCLSKDDQQAIDCHDCEHECQDDEKIYYPPLHY